MFCLNNMKLQKNVLFIVLMTMNFFIKLLPIKNRIVFIHLESLELKDDLLMIYNELKLDYKCVVLTSEYTKKTLRNNFNYMLNTFKQLYFVNTSTLTIINNNNYVISTFKRNDVKVLQVWHATGAIKKFGNCLDRIYPIKNYDCVLACSDEFIVPYSEAFGIESSKIKVLGMPRIDFLLEQRDCSYIYNQYPQLKDKKIVLYAPTFRGNIYSGMYNVDIDLEYISNHLGDEYVVITKYHPLIMEKSSVLNISDIHLYDLFKISYCLISDFSSIIFDYSLLNKPIILYAPDLETYKEDVGMFFEYESLFKNVCAYKEEIVECIFHYDVSRLDQFSTRFFKYKDMNNLSRVIDYIKKELI